MTKSSQAQEQIEACNAAFATDKAIALWEQAKLDHHATEKIRCANLRKQAAELEKEIAKIAKERKYLTYKIMNLRTSAHARRRWAVLNKGPLDRANRRILARKTVIRHKIEKQFMARLRDQFRKEMGVIPT